MMVETSARGRIVSYKVSENEKKVNQPSTHENVDATCCILSAVASCSFLLSRSGAGENTTSLVRASSASASGATQARPIV
jgi:hypothetical protein